MFIIKVKKLQSWSAVKPENLKLKEQNELFEANE